MKIVTDSAADLTPDDIREYNIEVAPLYILFPTREYKSEDLTPDEFYNLLEVARPAVPTTTQPSPDMFEKLYEKIVATGEKVLSIHISSGLSGTFNAAHVGAGKLLDKAVQIVDTMTLSGGQRFQILAAARAIKAGWSMEKITAHLGKIRQETEVIYTLETLDYLARGGRIGRVQALASSILKIKPIIRVDKADGKYSTVGKSRTITRALQDIAQHLKNLYGDKPLWVSVMHGRFEDKANELTSLLKETLNVGKLEVLRISPVLGVHTGPGIVGATVVPLDLLEGIG